MRRRYVIGGLLALALVTVIAVGLSVMRTSRGGPVSAGSIDDLETSSPKHFENAGFFVVKLESGEVIALSDLDARAGIGEGCGGVTWLPDYTFLGTTGWFREDCWGSVYSLNGIKMAGPSPLPMYRYNVEVHGDTVTVDTGERLCQTFPTNGRDRGVTIAGEISGPCE